MTSLSSPGRGAIWLWNAQPDDQAVPVGSLVNPELTARVAPGSPLRLLLVEADLWERELNPNLEAPEHNDHHPRRSWLVRTATPIFWLLSLKVNGVTMPWQQ